MKATERQARRKESQKAKDNKVRFMLFVAGEEHNSSVAIENLNRLCEKYLKIKCVIEIVDVFKDFGSALEHNVLITPTLIKVSPPPHATVYGNLSDHSKVLETLHMGGKEI